MACKKTEELRYVAMIGIECLCRHAALGAKITKPAAYFRGNIGAGDEFAHGAQVGTAFFTLP
jgi:hypothetical protein